MTKPFKEKYNDGCIKVFKLLLLLYHNKADYDDVIDIFGSTSSGERQHVILNKYLNSLKIFGIKVKKIKNKFTINNMPFTIKFEESDLKAIAIFEKLCCNMPEGKNKNKFKEFIDYIKMYFDKNTSFKYSNILASNDKDYSFYYSDIKSQLEECEKCVNSNFKINIRYILDGIEKTEQFCSPRELIFDNKQAYLRLYKFLENILVDIPVPDILNIEYLPTAKDETTSSKSVAFRLKGRLAKAYTLKDGEYVSEYADDGSILVINRNEAVDKLLSRLMRYDKDCVIERPKDLREQMKNLISDTLRNYE